MCMCSITVTQPLACVNLTANCLEDCRCSQPPTTFALGCVELSTSHVRIADGVITCCPLQTAGAETARQQDAASPQAEQMATTQVGPGANLVSYSLVFELVASLREGCLPLSLTHHSEVTLHRS